MSAEPVHPVPRHPDLGLSGRGLNYMSQVMCQYVTTGLGLCVNISDICGLS